MAINSAHQVRSLCGLAFVDPKVADPSQPEDVNTLASMVIADVTFAGTPKLPNPFSGTVTTESFFFISPLANPVPGSKNVRDKTIYRIACGVPHTPPSKPSVEYIQELIEKYAPPCLSSNPKVNPHAASVDDVVFSTRFRTRCAAAEKFFTFFGDSSGTGERGVPVCLVGDAAHIHPPAGGQGMNLGLRDAISLGPVMAKALTEGGTPTALKQVSAHMNSRRERAVQVIGMTKFTSGAVGMSPKIRDMFSWMPINIYTIRDWVVWGLGKSSWVTNGIAHRFSGLEDWKTV